MIFCGIGAAMDCLNPFFLFLLRRELIMTWFGVIYESEMCSFRECSEIILLNKILEIPLPCAFILNALLKVNATSEAGSSRSCCVRLSGEVSKVLEGN